jgi:hypothetical protein
MFDSKALGKRTVYSCFSIKQQSEVGAVARVAQVPAVGPVGAAACCPHLCNGDHGQWGVKTTRSPPVKIGFSQNEKRS